MNESKISVRYARAMFLTAKDKNLLTEAKEDMEMIHTATLSSHDLMNFLNNPTISNSQKSKAVNSIFKGKVNDITLNFLQLTVSNNREIYITDIARNFLDLYRNSMGIKKVQLVTAVPVDRSVRDNIITIIEKQLHCEVELKETVNADIIGGFIIRIDDKEIDASISSKLKKLRKLLINKSFERKLINLV